MDYSDKRIQELHDLYRTLSGQSVPCTFERRGYWQKFLYAIKDYDCDPAEALRVVITHLQKEVRSGRRNFTCLLFRWTIGQPDDFGELLAGLLALRRKPYVSPGKAAALRASGRSVEATTGEPQSAAQVLEREKMAEMLKQWRMENA